MASDDIGLEDIKGIGSSTKKRLKNTLNIEGVKDLAKLSKEDLMEVQGIGKKSAERILSNVKELVDECERCGSLSLKDEMCGDCLDDLSIGLKRTERKIENLELLEEAKKPLKESLEEVRSYKEDLQEAFDSFEDLEEDIKRAKRFPKLLNTVEERIEDNSDAIDVSFYKEKVESIHTLFRSGKYERSIGWAKSILDQIEKEKSLSQMNREELLSMDITEFCRMIAGVGSMTGEKLYKGGYKTVKRTGAAGAHIKEAGIKEEEAEILIRKIEALVGKIDAQVQKEERPPPPKPEEKEDIFLEVETREHHHESRREKRPEKLPERRPSSESYADKEIIFRGKPIIKKDGDNVEKDVTLYWVPAVILPIIFIIIGIVLFVM